MSNDEVRSSEKTAVPCVWMTDPKVTLYIYRRHVQNVVDHEWQVCKVPTASRSLSMKTAGADSYSKSMFLKNID
jgi:hypothetical protein